MSFTNANILTKAIFNVGPHLLTSMKEGFFGKYILIRLLDFIHLCQLYFYFYVFSLSTRNILAIYVDTLATMYEELIILFYETTSFLRENIDSNYYHLGPIISAIIPCANEQPKFKY